MLMNTVVHIRLRGEDVSTDTECCMQMGVLEWLMPIQVPESNMLSRQCTIAVVLHNGTRTLDFHSWHALWHWLVFVVHADFPHMTDTVAC